MGVGCVCVQSHHPRHQLSYSIMHGLSSNKHMSLYVFAIDCQHHYHPAPPLSPVMATRVGVKASTLRQSPSDARSTKHCHARA